MGILMIKYFYYLISLGLLILILAELFTCIAIFRSLRSMNLFNDPRVDLTPRLNQIHVCQAIETTNINVNIK